MDLCMSTKPVTLDCSCDPYLKKVYVNTPANGLSMSKFTDPGIHSQPAYSSMEKSPGTDITMSKPRCGIDGCKKPPQLIVGVCPFCSDNYCSKHRLPEDHNCCHMRVVKAEAKERNDQKLMSEATQPAKGV